MTTAMARITSENVCSENVVDKGLALMLLVVVGDSVRLVMFVVLVTTVTAMAQMKMGIAISENCSIARGSIVHGLPTCCRIGWRGF